MVTELQRIRTGQFSWLTLRVSLVMFSSRCWQDTVSSPPYNKAVLTPTVHQMPKNNKSSVTLYCQCNSSKPLSFSANERSWQFVSASSKTAREARVPDWFAHNNRARRTCSRTSVRYCSASRSMSASVTPSVRTRCRHFFTLTFSAMNSNSRTSASTKFQTHQSIQQRAKYTTNCLILYNVSQKRPKHLKCIATIPCEM